MKWARIIPSLNRHEQHTVEEGASYQYYTLEEIKETFETHKANFWVRHEFDCNFKNVEEYERFQKQYEIFCGGYLYFYDERNRYGTIDHVLYFRWKPFNKKGNYFVSLFLSPGPGRKRAGVHVTHVTAQHAEPQNIAKAGSSIEKGNGTAPAVFETADTTMHAEMMMMTTDTTDTSIDPPPPPAPPPPPLHES